LVDRALDSGSRAECFDEIVLSTDDEEIAARGYERGDVTVDYRPQNLAGDTATVLQAVLELMDREARAGNERDTVTILLPTCPFRQPRDVRAGFELLNQDADAVISVTQYDFRWDMSLEMTSNGGMSPCLNPSPLVTGNTRSQDAPDVYHPNGAFYIGRWDAIARDRTFFAGRLRGYPMARTQSADIDEPLDLKIAELMLAEGVVDDELGSS
jgi:CMP-N-acetylneuraminic acid synthetase